MHIHTANELAQYVTETLGTNCFIRCFVILKNKVCSYVNFIIGVTDKCHLDMLKNYLAKMYFNPTPWRQKLTQPGVSKSTKDIQQLRPENVENRSPPPRSVASANNSTREVILLRLIRTRRLLSLVNPWCLKTLFSSLTLIEGMIC